LRAELILTSISFCFQIHEGSRTFDEIVMNPSALVANQQDQSILSTLTLQPQEKETVAAQ
jgi:hypothetical protein